MSGPAVLVVEDDWLIAAEITSRIQRLGCELRGPAPSVAKALDLIQDAAPDVALLDVTLGQETSYPVADALLERQVPFAFVTAYDRDMLPPRYAGCDLLNKPFSGTALESSVTTLLSRAQDVAASK